MYFCWELLLGGSDAEKWGDHQKKKFFKNNSLKSIKFKEDYDIIFVLKITQNGGRGGSRTAAACCSSPRSASGRSMETVYICSTNEFELLFV